MLKDTRIKYLHAENQVACRVLAAWPILPLRRKMEVAPHSQASMWGTMKGFWKKLFFHLLEQGSGC